jgi:hypothetical protein
MSGTVSATAIAGHMAASEDRHPQVCEVGQVDGDGTWHAMFVITLTNGQRFAVTVEETA